MRWSITWAIFRKEILETLRDRRTLVVMLLLPMMLYPALMVGMSQILTHQLSQMESAKGRIAILGPVPKDLKIRLDAEENVTWFEAEDGPATPEHLKLVEPKLDDPDNRTLTRKVARHKEMEEWANEQFRADTADLVVVLPQDFQQILTRSGSAPVLIYFDQTNHVSRTMEDRFMLILIRWQYTMNLEREKAFPQLPVGFYDPIVAESRSTASAERKGGFMAGQILPMMLMIMVMLGAFYPAIDLTAGEKERGTMQTLLTAPAQAMEIIAGKFMTVFAVAITSAVVNLGSMALALFWIMGSLPKGSEQLSLSASPGTMLLVLLQLVPIAVFFSAMMLAVAIFAQSFKEAQNYLTPIYILVLLPAILGALPIVKLDSLTSVAPGLNFVLLIRELFIQMPSWEYIGLVLLSNTMYALLALLAAVKIFQSEQVMLGSQGSLLDMFRRRDDGRKEATPLLSFFAFALLVLLLLYVAAPLQQWDFIWGMIASQWGVIAGTAVLLLAVVRLGPRQTLQLRMPSLRSLLGTTMLALTAWLVLLQAVMWVQEKLMPTPDSFNKAMEKMMGIQDAPLLPLIFVIAVSPAICEELFFRGVVFGGLRRQFGKWPSILVTGLLFGLFHISLYRILPTAVLGVLITWIAWQSRSIWPGVLFHFLNNLLAVLAGKFAWFGGEKGEIPNWTIAVAIPVFLIGLWLVAKDPAAKAPLDDEGDEDSTGAAVSTAAGSVTGTDKGASA